MNDHEMEPGTLCFRCNICGQQAVIDVDLLRREKPTCAGCGSTPRARAIIGALSRELLGEDLGLWEFPERKEIVGLGTTDWEGYATGLAEKFSYKNTYYHQEPHFDIAAAEISSSIVESCDFVISSEVFEHVIPPVSRAFENAWKILRPVGYSSSPFPTALKSRPSSIFPR